MGAESGQLRRLKVCLAEQGNLLYKALNRDFEEDPHLLCVSHKSRGRAQQLSPLLPLESLQLWRGAHS